MHSPIDDTPVYNSRIIKVYLEYLEYKYPDLDVEAILDSAGIARDEVEDICHWFTQRHVDRFNAEITGRTGNPEISYEAGRFVTDSRSLGPMRRRVLGMLGPLPDGVFSTNPQFLVGRHTSTGG